MPDPITNEEQTIQALAVETAQAIRLRPDHDRVEYVAAIYRDGDTLRVTRLFTENNHFRADAAPAIAAAGGADRVVALVHNHPMEIVRRSDNQPDTLAANRLPSENDWNSARAQFADRTDVSLFVLGPDDELRRYDYDDRHKWLREARPGPFDRDGYNPRPAPAIDVPASPAERTSALEGGREDANVSELHAQARLATQRMEAARGHEWNRESERMAACAAYLGERDGFEEIVSVGLNAQTRDHRAGELLCVQGRSRNPDPYANLAMVPMTQVAATELADSSGRIAQLRESRRLEAASAEPQPQAPAPQIR